MMEMGNLLCRCSFFVLLAVFPVVALAGPLEPPAAPDQAGSAVYTLQDVVDRLNGLEVFKRNSGFASPVSAPQPTGSGSAALLDEIMATLDQYAAGSAGGEALPAPLPPVVLPVARASEVVTDPGVPVPSARFVRDTAKGILYDRFTGLVWLYEGNCSGGGITYATALANAKALKSGTCSLNDGSVAGDWRLPTINELQSLLDFRFNPPLSNLEGTGSHLNGTKPFNNMYTGGYWSQTTVAGVPTYQYLVALYSGARQTTVNSSLGGFLAVRGGNFRAPIADARIVNGASYNGIRIVDSQTAPLTITLNGRYSYQSGKSNTIYPGEGGVFITPSYQWYWDAPADGNAPLFTPTAANTQQVTFPIGQGQAGTYRAGLVVNYGGWDSQVEEPASVATVVAYSFAGNALGAITSEDTPVSNRNLPLFDAVNGVSGLTYILTSQASKGSISIPNSSVARFSFTPTANSNGADSFAFMVRDGAGRQSSPVTVNFSVTAVSDAPVNTVPPAIAGTATVGQTLTANTGTWTNVSLPVGSITYAYQWERDADGIAGGETAIPGATTSTYLLTAADQDLFVRVKVTATANGENAAVNSAFSGPVTP